MRQRRHWMTIERSRLNQRRARHAETPGHRRMPIERFHLKQKCARHAKAPEHRQMPIERSRLKQKRARHPQGIAPRERRPEQHQSHGAPAKRAKQRQVVVGKAELG